MDPNRTRPISPDFLFEPLYPSTLPFSSHGFLVICHSVYPFPTRLSLKTLLSQTSFPILPSSPSQIPSLSPLVFLLLPLPSPHPRSSQTDQPNSPRSLSALRPTPILLRLAFIRRRGNGGDRHQSSAQGLRLPAVRFDPGRTRPPWNPCVAQAIGACFSISRIAVLKC